MTAFLINIQILRILKRLKNPNMADTYSQIYIQMVFAVQNRNALLKPAWEEELYKYITGIVQNKGQKMLAINGTYNHIHFFIGMQPTCCLSDLVREIKKSSNTFIKEKKVHSIQFPMAGRFWGFFIRSFPVNERYTIH
jgi:putative transposase